MRATRPAAESAYAAIVRLVQDAASQRAPFVRLADRYAAFFLPVTLADRGGRLGGERRSRARRSPCSSSPRRARSSWPPRSPSSAGVSRAARAGVIVKGGGGDRGPRRAARRPARQDRDADRRDAGGGRIVVLERPARRRRGAAPRRVARPALRARRWRRRSCARRARAAWTWPLPDDVVERPGEGIEGRVEGRRVVVGSRGLAPASGDANRPTTEPARLGARRRARPPILVGVDGRARRRDRDGRPRARRRRRARRASCGAPA